MSNIFRVNLKTPQPNIYFHNYNKKLCNKVIQTRESANIILDSDKPIQDIKCVLVCIAKDELLYIEEFLQYHLKLGFREIIVYDNSDNNELHKYSKDIIHVIHFPGPCKQIAAYNHFIQNFKNRYVEGKGIFLEIMEKNGLLILIQKLFGKK